MVGSRNGRTIRTLLFAPANHERRVRSALGQPADGVILDLEDAVANGEKESARVDAAAALAHERRSRLYVRVNGIETPWCHGDLEALMAAPAPPDGIVLPMTESATHLAIAGWMLDRLEREGGHAPGSVEILPIVETARGHRALDEIAGASARVRRLAFGAGDYALDLGIEWTRDESELAHARASFVVASRAAGLAPPIDTVFVGLEDAAGFEASCRRAKAIGFGGKMCIHPSQLGPARAVFAPGEAELAEADGIVRAFEAAEKEGLASIRVGSRFVDYPIYERARRILMDADRQDT